MQLSMYLYCSWLRDLRIRWYFLSHTLEVSLYLRMSRQRDFLLTLLSLPGVWPGYLSDGTSASTAQSPSAWSHDSTRCVSFLIHVNNKNVMNRWFIYSASESLLLARVEMSVREGGARINERDACAREGGARINERDMCAREGRVQISE